MKNSATRLLLLSAMLSPASLYALGLGELRLNSALNQPLDADIELVSATADELTSLRVSLANEEAFRRFGLDRPSFLSNLTLRVEGGGQPVIRVRTTAAVTEPFVSLLIEASWSGGRVMREYTVLLDPPVFAPGQSAAPAPVLTPQGRTAPTAPSGTIERAPAPAPTAATPAPAPTPTPTPTPAPAAPSSGAAPAAGNFNGGGSYQVKPSDTLYRVAQAIRPGNRETVNQTMIALYRANAGAFDGNINLLRAGSVLRIPPVAEMEAIGSGEAAAEVARQYGAWRANPGATTTEDAAGRLRLVTPEGAASSTAGTSTNAQNANQAALNQRVQSLEAELAETKRLLDLKNAELARLQGNRPAGAPAVAPQAAPQPAPPAEAPVTPEPAAPAAEAPAAAPTPPAEAPKPVTPAAQAPSPPAAEPSLLDRLSDYWLYAVGLGLALIGALLFYIRRRQEADSEASIATLTPSDFESRAVRPMQPRKAPVPEHVEVEESPRLDDTAGMESPSFDSLSDGLEDHEATDHDISFEKSTEDTLSSETAIQLDQQDALAEADFHMAYGLYDQAADLVKIAVQRQPQRRDLKLKLLEIYFVWGNKDAFLDMARELHETRDQGTAGEWDKILIMGKQIAPEDALFAAGFSGSGAAENLDVNLEGGENRVDIDLFEAPVAEQSKSVDFELANTGAHVASSANESDLDFLLDEPVRGVDDEPTREMEAGTARTQETPTIESPFVHDRSSQTIREKIGEKLFDSHPESTDQTAELSLDEIGLNVDELDVTGSPLDDAEATGTNTTMIGDDELTRVARPDASGSFDKTVEALRPDDGKTLLAPHMEDFDDQDIGGGTLTVEKIDFDGDTVEQQRVDIDATAAFQPTQRLDMDLDRLSDPMLTEEGDTIKHRGRRTESEDHFSADVFGASGQETEVDLDIGFASDDKVNDDPTEAVSADLELPELEPVTMSEVGTKLDLARAYMDMGDPDGARSILEEVLQEGNPVQKQEAGRLLDSIR